MLCAALLAQGAPSSNNDDTVRQGRGGGGSYVVIGLIGGGFSCWSRDSLHFVPTAG